MIEKHYDHNIDLRTFYASLMGRHHVTEDMQRMEMPTKYHVHSNFIIKESNKKTVF